MKKAVNLLLAISLSMISRAQTSYDSITISRFVERFVPDWPGLDTVRQADYTGYIREEKTIWIKPMIADTVLPAILQLTKEIQLNGEGAISRCFTPRHSVNYYKEGRIVLYLLVCFQCDGLLFTGKVRRNFLVSPDVRIKQMDELREIFKELRGK
jgi:hypothetical protein